MPIQSTKDCALNPQSLIPVSSKEMDCFDEEDENSVESPSARVLRLMLRELVRARRGLEELAAVALLGEGMEPLAAAVWCEAANRVRGVRLTLLESLAAAEAPVDALLLLRPRGICQADLETLTTDLGDSEHVLLSGGILLAPVMVASGEPGICSSSAFIVEAAEHLPGEEVGIVRLRKCAVKTNSSAAPYWARPPGAEGEEARLLCNITLAPSASERRRGGFSASSIARGVTALLEEGLVILRGLFDPQLVRQYRDAVLGDMRECIARLRERGIDLLSPGDGSARIENFYELSMREALRCDLRRCPRLEALRASAAKGALPDLRHHPSVLAILRGAMFPSGEHQGGNWGRWNFEGPGPDAPPPLVVGEVAAVVTLPGCLDQTVHADTPHVFVHTHLPPHYANLFLPSVEDPAAGQTAFVLGSHRLQASKAMMTSAEGESLLISKLVRPHLSPGDCLLFDCRILHFGLANASSDLRPVLYVNYHADWFHDPKNWNECDRIFGDDGSPSEPHRANT